MTNSHLRLAREQVQPREAARLAALCAVLWSTGLLTACQSDEERLRKWLDTTQRAVSNDSAPLRTLPQTPALPAPAQTGEDPFASARIATPAPAALSHPEADRRREPLEEFALESIQMVGVLRRDGKTVGVVRVGEQIYHVGVGQYMGPRHGRVKRIDDREIVLRELVLDGETDWKEEMTSLKLEASE